MKALHDIDDASRSRSTANCFSQYLVFRTVALARVAIRSDGDDGPAWYCSERRIRYTGIVVLAASNAIA